MIEKFFGEMLEMYFNGASHYKASDKLEIGAKTNLFRLTYKKFINLGHIYKQKKQGYKENDKFNS